jgi:hypothetical protein
MVGTGVRGEIEKFAKAKLRELNPDFFPLTNYSYSFQVPLVSRISSYRTNASTQLAGEKIKHS